MLLVTGDTHGNFSRFSTKKFPEQTQLTKDDFILVCGDFGLIFDAMQTKDEMWWIKWLNEKPWTTLFIDGNHENHLRLTNMPEYEWHGGKVHKISDSVIHLMRGEMYEFAGKKCFCFGGANSHDYDVILDPKQSNWKRERKRLEQQGIAYRVKNLSWWENESANLSEQAHGLQVLEDNNWKCDYVFTHTAPVSIVREFGIDVSIDSPTETYLEDVKNRLSFDKWFFGHMHCNKKIGDNFQCLYGQIESVL